MIQDSGETILHQEWFKDRLQQYKDVHQDPPLDLMGWFTLTPVSGPEALHVPIHEQILKLNETAVLLAFHPSSVLEGAAVGAKLPLTIYESLYESGEAGDRSMEIDGQESQLDIRFRELPYSVETGEAEMISVDAVARAGGTATAEDVTVKKVDKAQGTKAKGKAPQKPVGQVDEKGKATSKDPKALDDSSFLSPEDEERMSPPLIPHYPKLTSTSPVISSLTARANAVKMLHTRIRLLTAYLNSIPLCYLTTPNPNPNTDHHEDSSNTTPPPPHTDISTSTPEVNHPLLRSILSLLSRLPLLLPPSHTALFASETLAEKTDVQVVSLLGMLGRSVKEAREMGRKFSIVETARTKGKGGFGVMGMSMGADGGWEEEEGVA